MTESLEKLQTIRREMDCMEAADENLYKLKAFITQSISLIRGSSVISAEAREKYAKDLEYEITHYLEENYQSAPNKRGRQLAFDQARNNALLWIKGAIHNIVNARLKVRPRMSHRAAA
jgi:hypothetical protein